MKIKLILLFVTIAGGGLFYWGLEDVKQQLLLRMPHTPYEAKEVITPVQAKQESSEILAIRATTNLDEQAVLYTRLIERIGPEQAQAELYKSGLSFDGQTHLLNHTVGDWLYEKYGVAGLSHCKDYFLSSCYHGFVIHAVGAGGFQALNEVMETCWKNGGSTVAVQCAHAIGHGLLAYDRYANLPKALTDCDRLATESANFPVYNCHDGVFMENIWAVHEDGKPSKDRWLKDSDPIYPCNDSRIDRKYIKACWSNQPMRLYQLFVGDLARVGQVCLSITDKIHQATCFDGLARQIHPLTKGSVDETFRMCAFMPKDWYYPCVTSIVRAGFGVGDRQVPYETCKQIDERGKAVCYNALTEIIRAYTENNRSERDVLCKRIPQVLYQDRCIN